MSKKALIFGLLIALMASSVGGAFTAIQARADYYHQGNSLVCTPGSQYAHSGDMISFSAYYIDGYGAMYPYPQNKTWSAVGGSPSTGSGDNFSTRFYTTSQSETRLVTVTDGYQTATCAVYLSGYVTPTPTPTQTLTCSANQSTVNSGDQVTFNAWGGNGSYSWSAADGYPTSGYGQSFITRFYSSSAYSSIHTVTVNSNGQWANCSVTVNGNYVTPTPYYGYVTVDHTVRNITRGGEGSTVTVYNGDRLQFTLRISTGNYVAQDVHVRDWLPQYVNYVSGSTIFNGSWIADGITNNSIALGDLSANRTHTLTFDGIVSGAPSTTLTNTINTHVYGQQDISRASTISVVGSWYYPTPTVYPTPYPTVYPSDNADLTVSEFGRNVTRGQSGERSAVVAKGNETIDIIVHVRAHNGPEYNVFLTNILPAGLNYVANSTTLNGRVASDAITSSGLNIGSLYAGQESVVKFSVTVDPNSVPAWGQVNLRNTTQVRADNIGTLAVQLPIALGNSASIAAVAQVKTGPADSIILALLISALVTAMYALYTRTEVFGRRMALAEIRQSMDSKKDPNFVR